MSDNAINESRRNEKEQMEKIGCKSRKSYKRILKANRPVRPQYDKNGELVPTKRPRVK